MKIGFIGAGNMGSALIAAYLQSGHLASDVVVSVATKASRDRLTKTFAVSFMTNAELANVCDVVILAVKPFMMEEVMKDIAPVLRTKERLVVSVASGLPLSYYAGHFGENVPVVRAMPNTPVKVAEGFTALLANATVAEKDKTFVQTLFSAIGHILWVQVDDDIDKITALSGSGPAYFFYYFNAMQKAAMAFGFDEATAKLLVLKTVAGATKLAEQSAEPFLALQQAVTAKGGTTEAALAVLNQHGVQTALQQAIHAAYHRACEISQEHSMTRST